MKQTVHLEDLARRLLVNDELISWIRTWMFTPFRCGLRKLTKRGWGGEFWNPGPPSKLA
ncbi:hypothetical protein DY000_02060962 [Brassica cretica]|uniref:Uncharacterized protein n=1 Tax=Brassica cretica TaxID=69181 RepID=A0ABQ7AMZ5_BRACR|nr:hypothetical protein DY000_02060963 [Brassica cretica]KAF3515552.1 hypothetical protein DY000_02060962 [Brassica cretica]